MTNYQKLMLMWVRRYLAAGFSLIPLKPKSKEPLTLWTEFQTRKASLEEIQGWITKWPPMNLGIVTGQISSLVVVDLDGKEGNLFGVQNQLVSGIINKTGNGKQLFYKWTEPVDNSASKIAPGVDIRGDGGYVVVCPSIHPKGKRYRWERFVPSGITALPIHIANQIVDATVSTVKKKESGWIAKALEEMKIGNIDDTLTSVCGWFRRNGATESDVFMLVQPHAIRAGATEGHLEEKIRNIWSRYEPKETVISRGLSSGHGVYQQSGELYIHYPTNDDSYHKFQQSAISSRSRENSLSTGFPTLDKYFEGGLKSERLFTVAARTGVGKTNFGIALSSNLCQQGKKVLYFSTEFQYQKIWNRYIATLQQPERFREHAFYVVDAYSPNLSQVEEAIKKVTPDVFIFDFIQHIGKEKEVLTQFMRGCQFLQRQYNCQGIILAQLNRNADWVENGKRVEPRMSMIEGSSTIEQASSRVLLLSEVRVTPEKNEILGVLDKNDTGDKGLINFALYKNPYILKEDI